MVAAIMSEIQNTEDLSEAEAYERVQAKADFFIKQLKTMLNDIPRKYQKKISEDLLVKLAHCLTNDVNFQIVKGLMDIQHVTEKYLFHLRLKVVGKQATETVRAIEGKPISEQERIRAVMAEHHRKQLCNVDMKLVKQLDMKVAEQQDTLEKAGFPGFYVTTNSSEIKSIQEILSRKTGVCDDSQVGL